MNPHEREMVAALEVMSLEEARGAIAIKKFGSPDYDFCSSWLAAKEASLRDLREEESLSISRRALAVSISARNWAVVALFVSAIAALVAVFKA